MKPTLATPSDGQSPGSARASALQRIRANIDQFGHHVYLVRAGTTPRLVYTIGLKASKGSELVLAGACQYTGDEALHIVNTIAATTTTNAGRIDVDALGSFELRPVHPSWSELLLLGANDFHDEVSTPALQIVPDDRHRTIDVPDMSRPFETAQAGSWRWCRDEWSFPVPKTAEAMTHLDALRGARITEAGRWEEDYFELFSGSGADVQKEDARLVPLAVLLAADPSLAAVTHLEVGHALRRPVSDGDWLVWEPADGA